MSLPRFAYLAPSTLSEALSLGGKNSVFVAGGTDLFVRMKERLAMPKEIIGIENIAELCGIDYLADGGLRIGAATLLADLVEAISAHPEWRCFGDAVRLTSSPLLRNAGTLGGNLCQETRCYYYNQPPIFRKRWEPCFKLGGDKCHVVKGGTDCYAVYSGDLAGPLMVMKASAAIVSPRGKRQVDIADLFSGSGIRTTILESDEILTEIIIPKLPGSAGFTYQKLRLRDTTDYPLLGISLFLEFDAPVEGKRCRDVRIVLSATGPSPLLVQEAARLLNGQVLTEKLVQEASEVVKKMATPVANAASSPQYRRDMVPVLTRRAFQQVLEQVGLSVS